MTGKGRRKALHIYKNDTPSNPKIASNFTTFGNLNGAIFDFRSSKCINYVFETSLWNHSFATNPFRVCQIIPLFLCSRTKSIRVIFMPSG